MYANSGMLIVEGKTILFVASVSISYVLHYIGRFLLNVALIVLFKLILVTMRTKNVLL